MPKSQPLKWVMKGQVLSGTSLRWLRKESRDQLLHPFIRATNYYSLGPGLLDAAFLFF